VGNVFKYDFLKLYASYTKTSISAERVAPQLKYISLFLFIWCNSPPVGQGLLIHEVSRSHTTTHHSQ